MRGPISEGLPVIRLFFPAAMMVAAAQCAAADIIQHLPLHREYYVHMETSPTVEHHVAIVQNALRHGDHVKVAVVSRQSDRGTYFPPLQIGPFADPVVSELTRRSLSKSLGTTGTVRFETLNPARVVPVSFFFPPQALMYPLSEISDISAPFNEGVDDPIHFVGDYRAQLLRKGLPLRIPQYNDTLFSADVNMENRSYSERMDQYSQVARRRDLPPALRVAAMKSFTDQLHYESGTVNDRLRSYEMYASLGNFALTRKCPILLDAVLLEMAGLIIELGQSGIGNNSHSLLYTLSISGDSSFDPMAFISNRRQATARLMHAETAILRPKSHAESLHNIKALSERLRQDGFLREYRMSLFHVARSASLRPNLEQHIVEAHACLAKELTMDDSEWFYFRGRRMSMERELQSLYEDAMQRIEHRERHGDPFASRIIPAD